MSHAYEIVALESGFEQGLFTQLKVSFLRFVFLSSEKHSWLRIWVICESHSLWALFGGQEMGKGLWWGQI